MRSASTKSARPSKVSGNDILLVTYEAYSNFVRETLEQQQNTLETNANTTQTQGKYQALSRFSLALPHFSEGSSFPVNVIRKAFQDSTESESSIESFKDDILYV